MSHKGYHCKWCNGYHKKKRGYLYCDKNPDGKENFRRKSEASKKTYHQYAKKRILETANTPEARKKKSKTVTNHWEDGIYDNVDFGDRFKGKKHTLQHRLRISKYMSSVWEYRQPKLLEKKLEKHNVITPVIPYNNIQVPQKTLIGGEFFEEDFFDYYDDDNDIL